MKKITTILLATVMATGTIQAEESINYNTQSPTTSAFGKYQFLADVGEEYCQRAPKELKCCDGTWTYTFKRKDGSLGTGTTNGAEWRTGANAKACQDAMFAEFQKDQQKSKGAK